MKEKLLHFFKQETVLCAAFVLAAVSMLFVPPDKAYLGYIDFRTLAILFCLMGVMAGLQKSGVFQYVAQALLCRVSKAWQLVLILVLLCFFSSMLVTNDVALITFVPFTLIVLNMIGPEAIRQLVIPVVVLQTIAANLGSMLTPIGNPQNLYLYGKSGLSLGAFLRLMLPYTLAALLLICAWSLVSSRAYHGPVQVAFAEGTALTGNRAGLAVYAVLFVLALLTVARVVPCGVTLTVTAAALLVVDRSIFRRIDYSLLLTFVGFFLFIGNLGRLPAFSQMLHHGGRCGQPGYQQCPGGASAVRLYGGLASFDYRRESRRAWDADCIYGKPDFLQADRAGGGPAQRGILPLFYSGECLLSGDSACACHVCVRENM